MKRFTFIATALIALASCSDSEFVGDQSPDVEQNGQGAIVFNSGAQTVTRADHVGADAADLLGEKFIVGGYKGGTEADGVAAASGVSTVFDNYIVEWHENTAAKTESNTSDWEYVGITAAPPATVTGLQTIKYWDYSASQYDFIAYSVGKGNTLVAKTLSNIYTGAPTGKEVWVTPITPSTAKSSAYKLRGRKAGLLGCYIADMKTVSKTDYSKEVLLDFRRLATKVRIALYETIPGYSVKEVKFYTSDNTPIKLGEEGYVAPTTTATLFVSGSDGNVFYKDGTYTISFPTIGSTNSSNADYNQAHVTFGPEAGDGTQTTETFGTINYGAKERNEAVDGIYLGRTSPTASFAGIASDKYYQYVLPNEAGAVIELRVDYTLVSVDGSGEEIKIYGAKAFVPSIYAKWSSNFAYTYIFKISDNTNGWTTQLNTDPSGLYPITFDAIITEAENYNVQSTITTVSSPSITTYQKGHDITKDEYSVLSEESEIYLQVIAEGTLKNDLGLKGQLYTLNEAATEAEVMDAINIPAGTTETTITGRNSLVLTKETSTVSASATFTMIPGVDGNTISVTDGTAAKFTPTNPTTPATVKYYAYVYDTGTYGGIYLATAPSGWAENYLSYYTDNTLATAASSTFSSGTYYKANSFVYSAVKMESTTAPDDWSTDGIWYQDPNGETKVGSWEEGNKDKVFYKKYTVNNKIYGVKVIKVVAGS